MNPNPDRFRHEWLASQYLEAFEREDYATQLKLWKLAETEPELLAVFIQVHDDLLEEQAEREKQLVGDAVAKYLKSAEIVREPCGPVTFSDVANELFRRTPDGLPAEAHTFNEKLRSATEQLPHDLGLSKLISFAEAKFGAAPREYWVAFRKAAIKLELAHASETEYQLAARRTKKPGGGS